MDRRHTKFFHHKPLLGHYTIKHKKKRGQSSLSTKEKADKDQGPVTHLLNSVKYIYTVVNIQ